MNQKYRHNITPVGFAYGSVKPLEKPDGYAHICADGHKHCSKEEVQQCIDAHQVFVCSTNHFHTKTNDAERCDQIKREIEANKERELQRQHEREMADRQIKFTENLRSLGYDFRKHGPHPNMPQIGWRDS